MCFCVRLVFFFSVGCLVGWLFGLFVLFVRLLVRSSVCLYSLGFTLLFKVRGVGWGGAWHRRPKTFVVECRNT